MGIVVCGNLTLDEIVGEGGVDVLPGGSALYVSAAAAFLGAGVGIAGNVGADYPGETLKWLVGHGVNLAHLRKVHGPTTRFRIAYVNGSRRLQLLQQGQIIGRGWSRGLAEAVHLGPVFHEISWPFTRAIRRYSEFVSLDIQGLVRRATENGSVQTVRKDLQNTLRLCDLVKASVSEAKVETSSRSPLRALHSLLSAGPSYVIVTLGSRGSFLGLKHRGRFLVPAFPDRKVVDPTGAGDVFVGSWLQSYLWSRDALWAGAVGSAFASLITRNRGLAKFSVSRRELFRRASWVYHRVRPLRGG